MHTCLKHLISRGKDNMHTDEGEAGERHLETAKDMPTLSQN